MSFIDKTHFLLVQGCNNVIIVRKIITIIIKMFFSDYNELLDRLKQSDVPFLDRLQLDVNFKDMCNHQTGIFEMTLLVI